MIVLEESIYPNDLLITVTMRLPLDMYYSLSPNRKAGDDSHFRIAKSKGCRGGAPYTVSIGGTVMPYMTYATEKECKEIAIEKVGKWTGLECRDYLEKLLTAESGGKRRIWSSMVSFPFPGSK